MIGRKSKSGEEIKFTRLFYAVLKVDKELEEKAYQRSTSEEKKRHISSYLNTILGPNNHLRICFTDDHIKTIVLENTLLNYFTPKGACKYNSQDY